MARINLLPREILERRKYERFYPIVIIVAVAVIAAILLVYVTFLLRVGAANQSLQQSEDQAQKLKAQAQAFAIFEKRAADLKTRKDVADLALKGRVDWGKIANEVSLVLPEEMWVDELNGQQDTAKGPYNSETGVYQGMPASFMLGGLTPDTDEGASDQGFKSMAKALVRLNDLDDLFNVWLVEASMEQFPATTAPDESPVTVQRYRITTGVVVPGATVTAPAAAPGGAPNNSAAPAPAPPSSPGQ